MNHRALHGRETALFFFVVFNSWFPSAFANSKASEFRRDIECEEFVAHSNFEGRAGLLLATPGPGSLGAITGAYLERGAREIMRPRFWGRLP